jgi:hypothetical protein
LESALEASQVNAIFLIWCSLEQAVEYLHLHKGGTLREQGLTGLTVCTINGKFSQAGSAQNQQIPVNQTEYFIVAKKGNPRQSTFIPWGPVVAGAVEPTCQPSHFTCKPSYWNQDANLYPYLKPRRLMRDLLHYYCTPGQLIFEGFAGSKSCVLGAIIKRANLVCIDNNPESASHLVRQYQRFQGDAAYFEQWNLDGEKPTPDRSCSDWMKTGMYVPNLALYGPDQWNETVPIENTEVTPFNSPTPSRSALPSSSANPPPSSPRSSKRRKLRLANIALKRARTAKETEQVELPNASQVSDDVIASTQLGGSGSHVSDDVVASTQLGGTGMRNERDKPTDEESSESGVSVINATPANPNSDADSLADTQEY